MVGPDSTRYECPACEFVGRLSEYDEYSWKRDERPFLSLSVGPLERQLSCPSCGQVLDLAFVSDRARRSMVTCIYLLIAVAAIYGAGVFILDAAWSEWLRWGVGALFPVLALAVLGKAGSLDKRLVAKE